MAKDIGDSEFNEEVIEKSKKQPVLVDFWAPWCGPCVMLKPIIEKIAKDYKTKLSVVKVNVEDNQENASKYGIMSIPAVKLFKNGKIIDEFVGAQPEEKIRQWLNNKL
jgi:putative thioredoxin